MSSSFIPPINTWLWEGIKTTFSWAFEVVKFIFVPFWYLWAIVFGFILLEILFNYLLKWYAEWQDKKWLEKHKTLQEWKKLEGREFEKIVAAIFEKLRYKTKIRRDGGIDIVAQKDGKRFFIQCKNMDKVIPDDVRAFWGSIEGRIKKGEGEKGYFVTTGSFTKKSWEFIKDKPIELIDGIKLEKLARGE